MIDNSRDNLLKLVRLAVGWEANCSLADDVNWAEVLGIAHEQGVAAIILDGYEKYLNLNPTQKTFFSLPENKPLKGKAFGRLNTIEHSFQDHLEALTVLAKTLFQEQIPFMIMKGFACARYYPVPEHRGCGDIDIYPGPLFHKSNAALISAGIDVEPDYYRHSTSRIKGVLIENHRVLCDLRGPRKQTQAFESQLESLGNDCLQGESNIRIHNVAIHGAVFPSANFNALFLPWHVSAHFSFERVTLRHLLDWALFLTCDGKEIDVELFRRAKHNNTYGFGKIADILTNLAIRYLGMPSDDIPAEIIEDAISFEDKLADRVFDYMFTGKPREKDKNVWRFRLNNVRRIQEERWKYKEIYGMSALRFTLLKVKGVLFKIGEDE